jgi:PPP family 3-phenylpropionic acid transporter
MPPSMLRRVWLPAFYFLYYAAGASFSPFLVIYYKDLGLSGGQIGMLTALPPLLVLFGAPLWSGLADASRRYRLLFAAAILGAMAGVALLSSAPGFAWLIPAVAFYALMSAPIVPLIDHATLSILQGQKDQYGKIRMWGAVGWGMAAPLTGALVERLGMHWAFRDYAIFLFIGLLVSLNIPLTSGRAGDPFWRSLRQIAADRRWLGFLATTLGGGVCMAGINSYLFLYLQQLGASETQMGLALSVATLSELFIFFFSSYLLRLWSARGMMAVALSVFVFRALAYSFTSNPWIVLGLQLLHGLSFSTLWVAGVSYADQLAPPGLGATAQGLFTAMFFGIGYALGGFWGGLIYQQVGLAWMFRFLASLALIGLGLFLFSGRQAVVSPR